MDALTSLADRLHAARRRLLWHRRPLAALACAAAVWAGIHALAPPPAPTVGVWTTTRSLPAGTVIAAGDLVQRAFTPGSVPDDRLRSAEDVVGRVLAAPVGRGAVLAPADVVGRRWMAGRPGTTAVPVRVTDPAVVPLLHVGDRVELVAADPQGRDPAQVLATDAAVLAVPARSAEADGALSGRLVVVGVPSAGAAELAAQATRRFLTVAWTR